MLTLTTSEKARFIKDWIHNQNYNTDKFVDALPTTEVDIVYNFVTVFEKSEANSIKLLNIIGTPNWMNQIVSLTNTIINKNFTELKEEAKAVKEVKEDIVIEEEIKDEPTVEEEVIEDEPIAEPVSEEKVEPIVEIEDETDEDIEITDEETEEK